MSIDDTNISFKKASNYEHVLKEILNTREDQDESQNQIGDLNQEAQKLQGSNACKDTRGARNYSKDRSDTLLPLNQIIAISDQKSIDIVTETRNI